MDIVIIGIDLGKNSCSLAGMDALGRVVLRRRMRRSLLESFAKGLGRCMIARWADQTATWPTCSVGCSQPMTTHQHCLYLRLYLRMEMTSSKCDEVGWGNFAGRILPWLPR